MPEAPAGRISARGRAGQARERAAEAEYVQACRCTTEVMYVREICADLGYDMSEPSIIYEDNKACISISEVRRRYR